MITKEHEFIKQRVTTLLGIPRKVKRVLIKRREKLPFDIEVLIIFTKGDLRGAFRLFT